MRFGNRLFAAPCFTVSVMTRLLVESVLTAAAATSDSSTVILDTSVALLCCFDCDGSSSRTTFVCGCSRAGTEDRPVPPERGPDWNTNAVQSTRILGSLILIVFVIKECP